MVTELYLESKGSVCKLTGDDRKIEKVLVDEFTWHFIPDLRILECPTSYDVSVTEDSLQVPSQIDYPSACFKRGLSERDIVSLSEYLLERSRQEKSGIYSLNSATASKGDFAVTFFAGATNSGKTSSMLELVKNRGYSFYSDEHSLLHLSRGNVVGGSRSIATRKRVLKDWVTNESDFYFSDFDGSDKISKLFIYPHLDHGLEDPITYQFKPLDFHWLLSKELAGVIRGVVKFTDNFKYPLQSLDTQQLSKQRVRETIQFAESIPCHYFQGSLEQMADFVEENFKDD